MVINFFKHVFFSLKSMFSYVERFIIEKANKPNKQYSYSELEGLQFAFWWCAVNIELLIDAKNPNSLYWRIFFHALYVIPILTFFSYIAYNIVYFVGSYLGFWY